MRQPMDVDVEIMVKLTLSFWPNAEVWLAWMRVALNGPSWVASIQRSGLTWWLLTEDIKLKFCLRILTLYDPIALICVTMAIWAWSHGTPTSLGLNKTSEITIQFYMYILLNQPFLTTLCPFPLLLSYFTFSTPPRSPSPLFLQESKRIQHNFMKSYQTILQKACVIKGLPLVTMQSPKNKAQATTTVLEAMMMSLFLVPGSTVRKVSQPVFL